MCAFAVLLLALPGRAQDTAPPAYIQYRLELSAPLGALAEALRSGLQIYRWQGYETMTSELLGRLVGEATAEAAEIVAAFGYFSPTIAATRDESAVPQVVRITVDPGEPTRVEAVAILFAGPVAGGDDADVAIMARVREEWLLPAGEQFSQDAWDRAKARAVQQVADRRYAAARIAGSEARIDPERRAATLSLTIDSGPPLAFGDLRIRGLARHDEARVRHLWLAAPGTAFSREQLDRFQRRLVATGYFASVQVEADPANAAEGTIPVSVSVIEAPSRRLELGLGYSTDTQARIAFDWRNNDLFARDYRLRANATVEGLRQFGELNLDLPERRDGWADSVGVRGRRTDIENLVTREWTVGARRVALDERSQPEFGLTYSRSNQRADQVLDEDVFATLFSYGHTWRTIDDLLAPRRGAVAQISLGAAPPGVSTRAFGRVVGRLAWFLPYGEANDFSFRFEAGAVIAPTTDGIPQYMLFRTGGATTVRGYDFESLGVREGDAVLGGRYLAVASAEYTRWIWEGIGAAAFVDVGNAFDERGNPDLKLGYGVGVRARSPIGPFRLDVAYGQDERQFRLHFSVGISF